MRVAPAFHAVHALLRSQVGQQCGCLRRVVLTDMFVPQVWELVPAALQESLQELVGEKGEAAVEAAEVGTRAGQGSAKQGACFVRAGVAPGASVAGLSASGFCCPHGVPECATRST